MLPHISPPHYTLADYNQWEGDWELIRGYPYAMSPSPRIKHQLVGRRFIHLVSEQLYGKKKEQCDCELLYETDWVISNDTVVRPDIAIVCGKLDANDVITTTPVLIVEIVSHSTRLADRNIKFQLYQQYGVKYYLMADPDAKTLEVFGLVNNQYAEVANEAPFWLNPLCSITLTPQQVFEG